MSNTSFDEWVDNFKDGVIEEHGEHLGDHYLEMITMDNLRDMYNDRGIDYEKYLN
tara:strand:- start:447 stop:611 length:165 start_codon:yes stop_codon:yes gene_type:complete